MSKVEKKLNLEEAFHEISTLIEDMEQNNPTLEQSLDKFERGIKLIKQCQQILETAEQKVQVLMQNNKKENYEITSE